MSTLVKLPDGRRVIRSDRRRLINLAGCCADCDNSTRLGLIPFATAAAATGGPTNPVGLTLTAVSVLAQPLMKLFAPILGKKKDRDKEAFYAYRGTYSQYNGSQYEELPFELSWQGFNELAWDSWAGNLTRGVLNNKASNPYDAGNLPHWIAYRVIDGLCKGEITPNDSAATVFDRLVWPVFGPYFPPNQNSEHPYDRKIMVDWVDRVLANLEIGETNRGSRQAHIVPSSLIEKMCPKPAAQPSQPTPVPTPAPTPAPSSPTSTTPLPVPVPGTPTAPVPVTPPTSDITPMTPGASVPSNLNAQIQTLIDGLIAQGANQQQAYSAALQALASKGVTVTPQVQAAVAEQVKNSGGLPVWVWPAAGVLVLGTLFLARRKRR